VRTRIQRRQGRGILAEARGEAARLKSDATREAEAALNAGVVAGKMESLKLREELDREIQRRREEWERAEHRWKIAGGRWSGSWKTWRVRSGSSSPGTGAGPARARPRAREAEIEKLVQEQRSRLERVAGLTAEDARREILQRVEDETRTQAGALMRDIKEQARRGAERDAKRIIAMATQRLAAEHTAETTVAAVALPSDEMKGRIIGREGRNIRAFETATGVDVIIDDTPDTVIVSCFDPIRREVARRSLEALIADGRIHPGRIEEIVAKCQPSWSPAGRAGRAGGL